MNNGTDYIELVKKAQLGDKECLNRLAETAREHLREYVQRLTLEEGVTDDIVQESVLEMFKVFGKLKKSSRFWYWLDGIAFNKVRSYYGKRWRHKTVSLSELGYEIAETNGPDGLADMVTAELKQIVVSSMRRLQPRHRAVLTMRCYKGMKYSEIAELMKCSEFGVQALFYRAKKALAKELSRCGLGKGTLLTALVLFGKLTAPSEAAAATVSVTAAACKVSVPASLVAIASGKTAIVSLTAAGALAIGGIVARPVIDGRVRLPENRPVTSLQVAGRMEPVKRAAEECWYYYPRSVDGPVMLRWVQWDSEGKKSYGRWWQDDRANYCFVKSANTIYINNYRMWSSRLDVQTLPTDGANFIDFLSIVEGQNYEMKYVSGGGQGLLVITRRGGEEKSDQLRIVQHYNMLEEEYFQYKWPPEARVVDLRDTMHKRGWTYFKITGRIDDKEVQGRGRTPFVYAESQRHGPWVELKVGDSIVSEACFSGLGRPWMGLHTIDTVRRDTGREWLWFETRYTPDETKLEVWVTYKEVKLVYTIEMEKDIVEKITFLVKDQTRGELRFTYLQEIDDVGSEFAEPGGESDRRDQREEAGLLWLMRLIESGMN
jgi:RNA polymerase sigma factor (sigma-70 family)